MGKGMFQVEGIIYVIVKGKYENGLQKRLKRV